MLSSQQQYDTLVDTLLIIQILGTGTITYISYFIPQYSAIYGCQLYATRRNIIAAGSRRFLRILMYWNADLIEAFGQTGIEVSTVQMNKNGTIIANEGSKSAIDNGDCDWIASLVYDTGTTGWAARKDQVDPRDGKHTDAKHTMSRWPMKMQNTFRHRSKFKVGPVLY